MKFFSRAVRLVYEQKDKKPKCKGTSESYLGEQEETVQLRNLEDNRSMTLNCGGEQRQMERQRRITKGKEIF